MKKTLFILILLLIIGVGILPVASGYMAKQRLQDFATALEKQKLGKLTLKNFSAGYLKSTATTEFDFGTNCLGKTLAANSNPDDLKIVMEHTIEHGPLLLSKGATPGVARIKTKLPAKFARLLAKNKDKLPATEIDLIMNFGNTNTLNYKIAAIKESDTNGVLSSDEINGNIWTTTDLSKFGMDMQTPKLNFSEHNKSISLTGATIKGDLFKNKDGVTLGAYSIGTSAFSIKDSSGTNQFSLANLRLSSDSNEKDNMIYGDLVIDSQQINIAADNFGPLRFKLDVRNFHAPAMAKLQEISDAMTCGAQSANPAMAMGSMMKVAGDLLAHSPEIEISETSLKTPQGDIKATAKVSYDGSNGQVTLDPSMILQIVAVANVSVPKAFMVSTYAGYTESELKVQHAIMGTEATPEQITAQAKTQAEAQIAGLIATGMLAEDGSNLKLNFEMKQGKMLLNGQPIPLPLM